MTGLREPRYWPDRVLRSSLKKIAISTALLVALGTLASGANGAGGNIWSGYAYQETATLSAPNVSVGNPVLASVDFGAPFDSIESICFRLKFHGDLLDPGEHIMWLTDSGAGWGVGQANWSPSSMPHVQWSCISSETGHDTSFLDDGVEEFEVQMWPPSGVGSVTISEMTIDLRGAKTPLGQLAELAALVESYGLDQLGSSLTDKLVTAQRMINQDKPTQACEALDSFIAQVEAQTGGALTLSQATELITSAEEIKTAVCPTS